MDLNLAVAYWKLDCLPSEDMPEIAMQSLESGFDSQSLRVLAGEKSKEMSTLSPLFEKCIKELHVPVPSDKDSVYIISHYFAQQILSSSIEPVDGAEKISWACNLLDNNECDSLLIFTGLASEYRDFNDGVNIQYYGKDKCINIQKELRLDIINEARLLLDL